jgi:outer membrane lipoprotein SlyB
MRVLLALTFSVCSLAKAQNALNLTEEVWGSLSLSDREKIQSDYIVHLIAPGSFGVIVDNQGVNESTPGTNAGSALGGAAANAAYVDHAIKSGSYSAKTQLGATLVGAILGSTLDAPATSKFHFRYAVKKSDGEIAYLDVTQPTAFRHPIGLCVSVPDAIQIEQFICTQNVKLIREKYSLSSRGTIINPPVKVPSSMSSTDGNSDIYVEKQGKCIVRDLPSVITNEKKCKIIGGNFEHEIN